MTATIGDDTTLGDPVDGRRARRERNRVAIVDALFALIDEGNVPPSADDIADRAGVSVSSVFRNFDGLDDLQHEAFERFQQRFAHLVEPAPAAADRDTRVTYFVDARLDLYEEVGPLLLVARKRSLDYAPLVEAVGRNRAALADQTRRSFAAELDDRAAHDTADLVALIDSLTSPESFEVMTRAHARSRHEIRRAWTVGIRALLDTRSETPR